MDHYQTIASGFRETIELITLSVDQLVPQLRQASELCSRTLLAEGKILACGNGTGSALAQIFCTSLLHRYEHDRPALPAMALSGDAYTLSAMATNDGGSEVYACQVRALGQAGDLLLAVTGSEDRASIGRAIAAAHDRDMAVIVLSGGNSPDLSGSLLEEDCQLHVDSQRAPRVAEMHIMLIHCLCEQIDQSLFGSYY